MFTWAPAGAVPKRPMHARAAARTAKAMARIKRFVPDRWRASSPDKMFPPVTVGFPNNSALDRYYDPTL